MPESVTWYFQRTASRGVHIRSVFPTNAPYIRGASRAINFRRNTLAKVEQTAWTLLLPPLSLSPDVPNLQRETSSFRLLTQNCNYKDPTTLTPHPRRPVKPSEPDLIQFPEDSVLGDDILSVCSYSVLSDYSTMAHSKPLLRFSQRSQLPYFLCIPYLRYRDMELGATDWILQGE
jgi:hypothetical protein